MVRRLLARHFEKRGAIVVEAGDAEQAIKAFRIDPASFDVVIVDIHLPDESGIQLLSRLRDVRPDIAVVFITGDEDDALARRALTTGNARYLVKPFEFHELDSSVARAISAPLPVRRKRWVLAAVAMAALLTLAWLVGYVLHVA